MRLKSPISKLCMRDKEVPHILQIKDQGITTTVEGVQLLEAAVVVVDLVLLSLAELQVVV